MEALESQESVKLTSKINMCKNAEAGCLATFRLTHRKEHQDSCPFELMACPNEGCPARVPRGSLIGHRQRSQHGAQQRCSVAVGGHPGPLQACAPPGCQTLGLGVLRRMSKVHRTVNLFHRHLAQLGDFLEEDDAMLMGSPQQEAQTIPEGSTGAELWSARGQDTL
ncbi:hypothetical protein MUG91_G234n25 [Manis pentadactyla]|nr:hypothetical protein MUG91_G234n25 [Manis pentadactyla]